MINDIIRPVEGDLAQYLSQYSLSPAQTTEAITLAQDTIMHNLRRQVMHGNAGGLLGLFSESDAANPHSLQTTIRDEYTDQLASRMNLPAGTALPVARYIIPAILNAMKNYVTTNGTLDRERLQDVIAGDLGTLRESLEKGLDAGNAGPLKDKLSEIFGFGIGGKY